MTNSERMRGIVATLTALSGIDAGELVQVERYLRDRVDALTPPLAPGQISVCAVTNRDPQALRLHIAKQEADAALLANLHPAQRKILEVCVGGGTASLADRARANGWG